jgi:proteasome lid subunit RPN8/RPN11
MFDTVLDQVSLTVGSHPVETGGALLGDYTSGVITRFLFDEDAETTAVSYIPSRRLNDRVNIAEAEGRLQFKGVLHSHPGNFDSPSGPDANSFLEGLKENPELSRYLAPIVTFKEGDARDNKMALPGGGWISFYVAMREGRNAVRIERTMPDIIHFGRDCRVITSCLGIPAPVFVDGDNGDHSTVTARIALNEDLELMLTADGSYPEKAPLAILHRSSNGQTTQLHLWWSATVDPAERLLRSLMERGSNADQSTLAIAFGLDGKVLTTDEKRAAELNLEPILVGDDFVARAAATEAGLFARSKGLLSETLRSRTVLINGAGSVGSYIAEQLVRSGIG